VAFGINLLPTLFQINDICAGSDFRAISLIGALHG
jgi:hypothetical protein